MAIEVSSHALFVLNAGWIVRTDVEGRVSAEGGGEHSAVGLWVGKGLIEEIRPLVDPRDVRTETLGGALEGVSLEGGANRKDVAGSGEEQRSAFSGCSFGRF